MPPRQFSDLLRAASRVDLDPESTVRTECQNSDQNNAKGTGPASVFGFLTEPFFLCLRTAAEKNSFEDQVLQAAHGH